RYWASASAWPVDSVVPDVEERGAEALEVQALRIRQDPAAAEYLRAVASLPFVRELLSGTLPFEWAPTRMVSDDPAKGLGRAPDGAMLPSQFAELLGQPRVELELVSAYFVPAERGTEAFV